MRPTVGWIGLGAIGLPMAQRVLDAGFPLRAWARRREAAQPLVERGAQWCDAPESLAEDCDAIATIVSGPDDVVALYRRLLPNARADAVVVDMTTASPRTAIALSQLAGSRDIGIVDAPVTGGVGGARQGKLTAFAGGEAATIARCRPLLEAFCERVVHCGGAGSGYRMKLVNQTMMAGALMGIANGAMLARGSGFSAAQIADALASGSASGPLFHSYVARMLPPGGAVTFTLGLLRKDLGLAREEATALGIDAPLIDFAIGVVAAACARFGERAGVQCLAEMRGNDRDDALAG